MTLRQFRKAQGLTQHQAGEAIGTSRQGWYAIEKSWPNISLKTAAAIVAGLGATITIDEEGARFSEPPEITTELQE